MCHLCLAAFDSASLVEVKMVDTTFHSRGERIAMPSKIIFLFSDLLGLCQSAFLSASTHGGVWIGFAS